MSKPLVILDSENVSLKYDYDIMFWFGKNDNSKNIFSLLNIVENNAEFCKTEYVSIITQLGETVINNKRVIDYLKVEKNFSFWWTTLLAEKSNILKSPEINNAIKIIAFKKWIKKKNYSKIILYSQNRSIFKAMSILCNELNIKLQFKYKRSENHEYSVNTKFYKYLPKILQSFGWLFLQLISKWPLKGIGANNWYISNSKITFLSSLINLDKQSILNGEFKSNYWPKLPDLFKHNNISSNWIHMYDSTKYLPNARKARDIINLFNKSKNGIETHTTIFAFISFSIIFKILINLIKFSFLKLKIYKSISNKGGIIWPFIAEDFSESLIGINATRNLLYMYLFKKAFNNTKTQQKGFYLQENQGWESSFIYYWKNSNINSHLYAIPHTLTKFWDLKRVVDISTYNNPSQHLLPTPDYIGYNSEISKKMYLNNGIPYEKLIQVEALRYLHLNKKSDCKLNKLDRKKYTVLLLGDVLKKNTIEQIKLLNKSYEFIKTPIQFLIKAHPATSLTKEDFLNIDFITTDKPINEIVNCCEIVFASSTTSASFDTYYLGAKVVTIVNARGLNTSPLRGFQDAVFVTTPLELANVLNDISKTKKIPQKREEFLYIDKNIPRWKKILEIT